MFETADQAGTAVAVALQDATCTFTVAPTPTPPPTPTPTPVPQLPGQVRNIAVVAGNGKIGSPGRRPSPDRSTSSTTSPAAARARATGPKIDRRDVDHHERGHHRCRQRRALRVPGRRDRGSASPEGRFTEASVTVTPIGRPSAPDRPTGFVFGGGVRVAVGASPAPGVAEYRYECSSDGGATWPRTVTGPRDGYVRRGDRARERTQYVCRAFATNASGVSDASAVSDALRPCGSAIECTPIYHADLIAAGAVLGLVLLILLFALYRGRPRDYVVAVVDVVHTRNLGHGSAFAIAVKPDGIDKVRGGRSDVRIQYLGRERFRVFDRGDRKQEATAGIPLRVVDGRGTSHELVLWAFATPSAAAAEASRR